MGRENLLQLTEHHLYPKVHRLSIRHNKVLKPRGVHRAWHEIADVEKPEGALTIIVQRYLPADEVRIVEVDMRGWRGQIQPLRHRPAINPKKAHAFNLVFPTERPLEILKLWAWEWVPRDFIRHLAVVIGQNEYPILPDVPDPDFIAKIRHRQECKLIELQHAQRLSA